MDINFVDFETFVLRPPKARLLTLAAIVGLLCCVGISPGFAQSNQGLIGKEQQRAVHSALSGEWVCNIGTAKLRLRLTSDGRFLLNDTHGDYYTEAATLRLKSGTSESSYQFELAENQLTLSGGDISQSLKFTKLRGIGDSKTWFSDLSERSLKSKSYRIVMIVVVVCVCRLVLYLFRTIAHFIIYSEWGPLKSIYRHQKNRTMTLYSLVINISKYVVYFSALGFILGELGVNYTAYLASLSVIGLAIGFGSQGLVQDMVTGFFIIFEGQFNVGDMVEIPPHIGIVEELGLRMTRLRNYLGQKVVIPNRNIAAVGNFIKGAQEAQVDVAIANKEVTQEAQDLLRQVANEISCQFAGTIVSAPKILSESSLATGEHFVRVCLAIWPQQQWVVEQQMLPRIREAFSRKGIEIPNDRVIAFYRPREETASGGKRQKTRYQETAKKK